MRAKTTIKASGLEDVFNLHDLEAAAIEVLLVEASGMPVGQRTMFGQAAM